MIEREREIKTHIINLLESWDKKTHSLIPDDIRNDPFFIKAINYIKLRYGSINSPVGIFQDYDEDSFYISVDVEGKRGTMKEKQEYLREDITIVNLPDHKYKDKWNGSTLNKMYKFRGYTLVEIIHTNPFI
ncbi:hypothetical protein [Marinobacter salarius]|uniref:hypothetical protein n=1 Tax=Marinobacter salarius TaxID=1420917 RepID=UPI003BA88575